jgi:uncharacterized protein (TIGR00297 family)
MGEEMQGVEGDTGWRKTIPEQRDRLQSRRLVWVVGGWLVLESLSALWWMYGPWRNANSNVSQLNVEIAVVSLVFAVIVLGLRAATPVAAAFGGMICLFLLWRTASPDHGVMRSGLAPLLLLFVLTFVSTRAGRGIKAKSGIAEKRSGRNAAQVIANLGVAALSVGHLGMVLLTARDGTFTGNYYGRWVRPSMMIMCLAALVEATADTVSSEIGQAFGGTPRMLVGLRLVAPGTDGAVTLVGSCAGIAAGGLVALGGAWAMHLRATAILIAFGAGICGLFFDSLLGATVERRGWLGNDLVNFTSTLFAAVLSAVVYRFLIL